MQSEVMQGVNNSSKNTGTNINVWSLTDITNFVVQNSFNFKTRKRKPLLTSSLTPAKNNNSQRLKGRAFKFFNEKLKSKDFTLTNLQTTNRLTITTKHSEYQDSSFTGKLNLYQQKLNSSGRKFKPNSSKHSHQTRPFSAVTRL